MKVYELKRDSWHYKLANYGSERCPSDNFCYYVREVLWGLTKIGLHALWISILTLCFGVVAVAFLLHGIIPWEVGVQGAHLISVVFTGEVLVLAGGLLLFCGVKLDEWQKEKRMARWAAMRDDQGNKDLWDEKGYWPWEAPKPPKEPGFFGIWYKTFKEKTCVKLVFK